MGERATDNLNSKYERAAVGWHDKMRVLGYYDGYLGFLSQPKMRTVGSPNVIDMGCGTAAFADAWVAVNGSPQEITLVDPSSQMLDRGAVALENRNITPIKKVGRLGETKGLGQYDEVLASHLIEHCEDPKAALHDLAALMRPGGRLWLVVSKPHWCNAIIWLQWRHRTFARDEVHNLIKDVGLLLESEYAFPSGPPSRTSMGFVARSICTI